MRSSRFSLSSSRSLVRSGTDSAGSSPAWSRRYLFTHDPRRPFVDAELASDVRDRP
jgi:hypothetical protein